MDEYKKNVQTFINNVIVNPRVNAQQKFYMLRTPYAMYLQYMVGIDNEEVTRRILSYLQNAYDKMKSNNNESNNNESDNVIDTNNLEDDR
jgi:hypothetical protein